MRSAIVKLNEGVSGAGQRRRAAGADCRRPARPTSAAAIHATAGRTWSSSREATPFDVYIAKFAEGGGIVEERIEGEELQSPSVQLRVLPDGEVELLSTHDQLLGGASGQSYLGCVFPAAPEYARMITEHAAAIGHRLARSRARSAGSPSTSSWSATRRRLDAVRDRAQPAQGRDHPPVPHPAVPDRWPLRPVDGAVPHAAGPREAPGRDRPPRVGPACAAWCRRTSSTSWPGTACTSTSPVRRASSST